MPFPVRCDSCGASFDVLAEYSGRMVRCIRCGQVFRAAPPYALPPAPPPPPASATAGILGVIASLLVSACALAIGYVVRNGWPLAAPGPQPARPQAATAGGPKDGMAPTVKPAALAVAELRARREELKGRTVRVRGVALLRPAGDGYLLVFGDRKHPDGMAPLDGADAHRRHAGELVEVEVEGTSQVYAAGFFLEQARVVAIERAQAAPEVVPDPVSRPANEPAPRDRDTAEAKAMAKAAALAMEERERAAREAAERERERAAAIASLISGLAGDKKTREAAVLALGRIGVPAVPSLLEALGVEGEEARRAAAMVLGHIGPAARDALPALRKLAEDDAEDRVREAAAKAVERIGRK